MKTKRGETTFRYETPRFWNSMKSAKIKAYIIHSPSATQGCLTSHSAGFFTWEISARGPVLCCDGTTGQALMTQFSTLTTAVMTLSNFFIFFCNQLKTLKASGKRVPFKDEQQETSTDIITWNATFCFRVEASFSPTLIKSSTWKKKHITSPPVLDFHKATLSISGPSQVSCFSGKYKTFKKAASPMELYNGKFFLTSSKHLFLSNYTNRFYCT